MQKKLFTITIITLIILSSTIFTNVVFPESVAEPAKLKIYIGPTSVPADNSAYNCIFVQLQDSSGKPARALQDTTISLSSSLTNIGTVDSSITIPRGSTYAAANFYSTYTPGTTTIAATASGYATVQATISTIGPIPSAIAIYGFPSTLPADGGSYNAIMVQLQDSSGSPAKAPTEGVQVTLSCSNTNVGTVTPLITIPAGQTYAIATFNTTTTKGEAMITAVAEGYTSNQLKITTQNIAATPDKLSIYVGPLKVPADKNTYRQIAIQLKDASGNNIANATSDIIVTIASSDETIAKTDSQIIIPKNQTYALATLTTKYKAGTTTITAVATNLDSTQGTITTTGFIPFKLAVYCVPATLPADNATYQIIQVQLQDSQGRPAKDPEANVNVNLVSSDLKAGDVTSTIIIPFGKTHATGTFTATNAPSSTIITAQASYIIGEAKITTYQIDFSALKVTATANPENVANGKQTEITTYITIDGVTPITNATVKFTSNNGGKFSTTKEQGEGYYTTTFTAPSFSKTTTCTVTASASKTGYIGSQGTVQITVGSASNTSNSTGIIELCIKDSTGNPANDTLVISTSQPTGAKALSGITNATGYVTFKDAIAGSYTFNIIKQGYMPMNQTINFKGQPMSLTLMLSNDTAQADYTLMIVVSIIVTAIVISAISALFLIRRRKAARIKALQQLQKQMKYKYQ